ncbi:unnamed protein product [Adineta steineri]|uniref:Glycosyl hydrolase family 13 catalytic domain-containing protein n=1 Tax=Adineta steineri TaxID=433720 RepID=A0A813MCK0_9BILA|nr:unnamed protein product [Adineta steineri]CAF4108836.1 unnamed protein product [Adineta steineri]
MCASIEFRLFAPRIEHVFLTGSFNKYQDIEMCKDVITGDFFTTINLEDGEYLYKYRISSRNDPNKIIDIIDPYATRVEDDDKGAILKIHQGKKINGNEYIWKYDGKNLPENRDLIIYEIFIADFTEEGTIRSAISKLDYLANDLGINCIELMPVQAFLLGHDWGYTIRHFFAVELSYGSSEDLKNFIDQCHSRGIRVMMDVVFNHAHTDCPLNKIDSTYWFYEGFHHPEHPEENWGPEFNYDFEDEQHGKIKPALKFIGDVIRFWIEEYHIDGMRFDAAKQIDNYKALEHFDSIGHSLRSPFYTVAEYIPATSDIVKPKGPLDGVWRNIVPLLQDQLQFPDNTAFLKRFLQTSEPIKDEPYIYTTSVVNQWACHDNERLLYHIHQIDYFDEEAFKRLKIAASWLLTIVGIPLIWMGDEWGEDKIIGNENRTKKINKLDWSARLKPDQYSLLDCYHRLISLRKSSSAIQSKNINFFHQNFEKHIVAYYRWSDETNEVVVAVFNFSMKDQQNYFITNWPKNGQWQEVIGQTDIQINKNELEIDLKSYESKIFVFKG